MSIIFIYGLFDPRNGELRYIGKTVDISSRLKQHIKSAKYNGKLYRNNWIRQLLSENLEPAIEILEECTEENWQEIEKAWIKEAREKGAKLTNIVEGGNGFGAGENSILFGRKLTEEHKRKIADKVTGERNGFYGKTHTEEMKQYYRELFTGREVPRERIEKMSRSLKGRIKTEEERKKLSEALKGRKFSDEHRRKLSEVAKNRKYSQETIDKIRQSKKGYKVSEEQKLKISLANSGRKRTEEFKQRMRLLRLKVISEKSEGKR